MTKVDLKIEDFIELEKMFCFAKPINLQQIWDSENKPLSYAYSLEKIFIS